MLLVGLTGGIGSGKSTVARMLERRGAVAIDADDLARRAIEPGTPGHHAVLRRFGPSVLGARGAIDRNALAARVFTDDEARRDLEAVVHPEVARLFQEFVEPYRKTDRVVVYSVPLLVENELAKGFDVVMVVTAPRDVRTARLLAARGMRPEDSEWRMAAQASDEDRESVADIVIRNDGSLGDLDKELDAVWAELERRADMIGRS